MVQEQWNFELLQYGMSQEIMGMTRTSVWLKDLIHHLNLRSTILPVPHSVEVNVPFWKNNDLDRQCKPEPDDMSNNWFLRYLWNSTDSAAPQTPQIFYRSEIDWQFKPNPDDMTNTHFIDILFIDISFLKQHHQHNSYFNTLNLTTWPSSRPWFFQDVCLAFEIFFVQVHLFRTITKNKVC